MEKTLKVKRYTYRRKIRARMVTFICRCHPGGATEVTEKRLPGPLPSYCLSCRDSGRVEKHKAEAALKRYYEKKKKRIASHL